MIVTSRRAGRLLATAAVLLGCSLGFGQQANGPTQPPDNPAAQPQNPSSSSSSSSTPPPTSPPRYWKSTDPNAQVTVLEDTLLRVETNARLSTRDARDGEPLVFTLDEDVVVDDVLIIPRGATLHGVVVQRKKAGKLTGSPDLILKLVSLDLGGRNYPVYSYEFKVEGASKTRPTETKVKTGAAVGMIAGAIFNGSANGPATAVGVLAGMGTGAAVGAGVGTAVAVVTPGPVVEIPAESQIDFYLASPISVVPVSEREAERLAEGLRAGGPVLYVRGETP